MTGLSLRARLTLVFVLFFGGTLCAFSYYLYNTVNSVFQSEFDALLLNFTSDISDSIDFGVMGGIRLDSRQFKEGRKIFPFPLKETVIQIRDLRGRSLEKSSALGQLNLPFHQNDLYLLYKNKFFFRNWTSDTAIVGNQSFRIVFFRIMTPFKPPVILQVAVPDRFVKENSIQVLNIFTISIPIVLLIAAVLGYTFSSFGLSPIQKLVDRLKSMGAIDLSKRLDLPTAKDELHELSQSINSLLDRLESAFKSQETFVSDASHQLKTPLAILKGELELLGGELIGSEATDRVRSLREELDDLISLVNNLLLLARVDAGEGQLVLSQVSLDEVVTSAVERLTHLAKEKQIRLKLNIGESLDLHSISLAVKGDYDLLVSLFQSLLENAIKYSPPQSEIEIKIKNEGRFLTVDLLDQGPGISEKELPMVFERFHRAREVGRVGGSGLGLSIAKRIADLHHASLELSNRSSGGLLAHLEIKTF